MRCSPRRWAHAPSARGQLKRPFSRRLAQTHKPEPSQNDWTKVCGKDQNAEVCYTTRDFVSDQGQPVLAAAVYDIKSPQPQKVVRFLMPLGLLLKPGIRFTVDQGQPNPGQYAVCFPNGCFAEAAIKDDAVNAMKKGTTLNVSVQNQAGREVTFGPGDMTGELGFISPDNHRTATLLCLDDGEVGRVSYADLKQLFFQNPKFGYFLLKLIARRMFENEARARATAPMAIAAE